MLVPTREMFSVPTNYPLLTILNHVILICDNAVGGCLLIFPGIVLLFFFFKCLLIYREGAKLLYNVICNGKCRPRIQAYTTKGRNCKEIIMPWCTYTEHGLLKLLSIWPPFMQAIFLLVVCKDAFANTIKDIDNINKSSVIL